MLPAPTSAFFGRRRGVFSEVPRTHFHTCWFVSLDVRSRRRSDRAESVPAIRERCCQDTRRGPMMVIVAGFDASKREGPWPLVEEAVCVGAGPMRSKGSSTASGSATVPCVAKSPAATALRSSSFPEPASAGWPAQIMESRTSSDRRILSPGARRAVLHYP